MEDILVYPAYKEDVPLGGPMAVVKLLYKSNNREEFAFLEPKHPKTDKTGINKVLELSKQQGLFTTAEKFMLDKLSSNSLFGFLKRFRSAKRAIKLHEEQFEQHDKILCMDVFVAYFLLKKFPRKEISISYHGQGSSYNEICDLNNARENIIGKKLFDRLERRVYDNCDIISFPSSGSREALEKTNPHLEKVFKNRRKHIEIINNSIDQEGISEHSFKYEDEIRDEELVISTVSTLIEAKGVDKIPKYIKKLKEEGINVKWILKGSGSLKETVKEEIKDKNIEEDVLWIEERLSEEQINGLFTISDGYIMSHRFSIFDLATIEAMSLGTVPLLSKIGGNKEYDRKENVIFLEELETKIDKLKSPKLEELKSLNKDIAKNYFSLDRMSTEYAEMFE